MANKLHLGHFCRGYRQRKAKPITDRAGVLRDQIANVESVRRAYQRALNGEAATKLSTRTLEDNIARTTRRLTELRAELTSLTTDR
jgi:hypothetical protein